MKHYDAEAIRQRLPWAELVDALERGFREGCSVPQRHHHEVPVEGAEPGILLLMPAWQEGGLLGLKMATLFGGNAAAGLETIQATYLLCSATTGVPLASFDGGEITARRTAAASALGSRYLSAADARRLLVVGTGRLAPLLAQAHAAVRPIDHVEVWGRSPEKTEAVCKTLREAGMDAAVARSLEDAVRGADIVSCATSASEPLVHGDWLGEGVHLDLVGSFQRSMREADDAAVARCSVYVDVREAALSESGELLHALDRGVFEETDIRADLFDLARGSLPGRAVGERTLFKSVGVALEDLCAAKLVHGALAD
ncbi:MAG: ornithine cyclodeaminase family protein [Acidobacteriota bacterium]